MIITVGLDITTVSFNVDLGLLPANFIYLFKSVRLIFKQFAIQFKQAVLMPNVNFPEKYFFFFPSHL